MHRVQRVPVTESQGRVHTSAAGVLVMPEAEQVDVVIDENDLRIDVFRSSGPGGQSVNTTDSAVRITHVPTGIVASCQNEKSQLQNKEQAMRILRARLLAVAQEEADAEASLARKSQVRTVDRSERIRTYNFPENRISDHRTGYKAYNLDAVLDGDLQPVLDSCVEADLAASLESLEPVTPRAAAEGRRGVRSRPAGVASPEHDAAELLAHVLGTTRGRLSLVEDVPAEARRRVRRPGGAARRPRAAPAPDRLGRLPARRARGRTRGVRAAPGDRAARRLGGRAGVDPGRAGGGGPVHRLRCDRQGGGPRGARRPACTPSSSTRTPTRGRVRNLAGTGVDLRLGDLATAFDDLLGTVDVVVCNPPYIPLEAWESVAAEARDHDPHLALFSGADGLDAIRALERRAAQLLRARGSGGLRARRRPGRVGAGGLRRPPGGGARCATTATWPGVRATRRPGWHDNAMRMPTSTDEERETAIEAAALAIRRGRSRRAPDRHRLRGGGGRVRRGRGRTACSRPRGGAGTCRLRC